MLKMKGLHKVYRTELVETQALNDFHLEVKTGEFVAVTGPSGSGKTTFLTIAGLLESPTGGLFELDGQDVSRLSDAERSRLRNEKIGFIFQAFNLIPDLSVLENVEVPLHYRGFKAAERRRRSLQALERVGLAGRAAHLPSQLSGGQQQRVAIARALAGEPKILLADEPTGNLDQRTAAHVYDLMLALNEKHGTSFVIVTHDVSLAAKMQRVLRLQDGILLADDAV